MSEPSKVEHLFGRIAVACGYVTERQVDEAVLRQRVGQEGRHLGRIMVELGQLTEDQLLTVLAIQRENRTRAETSAAVRQASATLGSLAVAKRYCTEWDIHECIEEQARLERFNLFFRLGEVLVSRGKLTVAQVAELLGTQNITILGCPGCFSRFNVLNFQPGKQINCPKCNTYLEVPTAINQIKVDGEIGSRAALPM